MTRRRLVAIVAVAAVLTITSFGLWRTLARTRRVALRSTTPSEGTAPSEAPSGYYVIFPAEAGPPGDTPNGGATLAMKTNLPDGTLVSLSAEGVGGPGGDSTCCPSITGGEITFQTGNGSCPLPPGAPRSTGFKMTVEVLPEYYVRIPFGGSGAKKQPPAVQAVLGPNFEQLIGAQVQVEEGVRELIATATFDWPRDTCEAMLRNNDLFLPEVCPTTTTKGRPLAMEQAANPEAFMNALMPAIAQVRLCELWRQWMVPAFRDAHPWPRFRDDTKAWIDGLGSLTGTKPDQFTALTWAWVQEQPAPHIAQIVLRGTVVAEVQFVPLPFPKGCRTGCEPFWGITRFDPV